MAYLILILFAVLCVLALIEDRLPSKYHNMVFAFVGLCLVMMAGLREIGLDPDSENYAAAYRNYYTEDSIEKVEFTYTILCAVMNMFTDDPHSVFLFYALFGVALKFIAFRRYTNMYLLATLVYLSFYFELHEMTQMRTGILSGLYLLAIPYIADKKRLYAFFLFLIGFCFHYSAALFLPLLFLSNKSFGKFSYWFWLSVIPFAYVMYFVGGAMIFSADLPLIGTKLAAYQEAVDKGINFVQVNVFGPFQLLTILIFYYLMVFQKTIIKENKYFPLMMKFFAIGMASYIVLAFLPVMAQRVSYLLRIVTIILFVNIYLTIRPKWLAIIFVELLALIYMNYGLQYIDFSLFFEIGT